MNSRTHRVVLVLLLTLAAPSGFFALSTTSSFAQGLASDVFSGTVRDGLGRSVGRALVLMTPIIRPEQVRTVLTDDEGRYRFDRVPPGTYRVTAIKQGYAAAVGRVSSWLDSRLDLVLASEPGAGPKPLRPDWVVTAPPRDVLREIGASTLMPPPADAGLVPEDSGLFESSAPSRLDLGRATAAARRFLPDLTGHAEQTFTSALTRGGTQSEIAGGRGSTTILELGSPIGDRAQWRLAGRHEDQDTDVEDGVVDGREASSDRVLASFRYETADQGLLSVRAYYDRDAYRLDAVASAPTDVIESRERRAWGYDADWRGTVGGDASVQVDVRYAGGAAGRSGRRGESGADRYTESDDQSSTSVLRTSARVSKKVGANHSVNIGVKAGVYSLGELQGQLIVPSANQDPSLFAGALGRQGWSVSVNAGESWSVTMPLALDLGVDVSRTVSDSGSLLQAVVPQAGLIFSPDARTRIRGLVSYVAARRNDPYAVGGTVQPVSDPVGYRLRVERTVRERLTFILDAESRPFFYGVIGGGWDGDSFAARTRVPYVSDASARVQETGLTVETRPLRGFTLGLGGNAGHVEGRVAPSLPDAEIARAFEDGDLRFTLARFEGRLESTGTQILVHMMRIDARSGASGAVVRDDDRRMEFDLVQDLAFHPAGTQWTLLASYRSDTQEDDPGIVLRADSGRWGAGSRVSGGVAVKF